MRFRIYGADRETGKDRILEVDAASSEEAKRMGGAVLLVERTERVDSNVIPYARPLGAVPLPDDLPLATPARIPRWVWAIPVVFLGLLGGVVILWMWVSELGVRVNPPVVPPPAAVPQPAAPKQVESAGKGAFRTDAILAALTRVGAEREFIESDGRTDRYAVKHDGRSYVLEATGDPDALVSARLSLRLDPNARLGGEAEALIVVGRAFHEATMGFDRDKSPFFVAVTSAFHRRPTTWSDAANARFVIRGEPTDNTLTVYFEAETITPR